MFRSLGSKGVSIYNFITAKGATVEGEGRTRRVRFTQWNTPGWTMMHFEVVAHPDGTVIEVLQEKRDVCLATGTQIATPDGERPVESLVPGDRVIAYDPETKKRSVVRVLDNTVSTATETVVIGGGLRVTGEHPIYADGEWRPAHTLTQDSKLVDPEGKAQPAASSERREGSIEVYDLIVDKPHTFFAAGYLVHNGNLAPPKFAPAHRDAWTWLWAGARYRGWLTNALAALAPPVSGADR